MSVIVGDGIPNQQNIMFMNQSVLFGFGDSQKKQLSNFKTDRDSNSLGTTESIKSMPDVNSKTNQKHPMSLLKKIHELESNYEDNQEPELSIKNSPMKMISFEDMDIKNEEISILSQT
jgi:hypothetical protein